LTRSHFHEVAQFEEVKEVTLKIVNKMEDFTYGAKKKATQRFREFKMAQAPRI
jgi:hypothetical protein